MNSLTWYYWEIGELQDIRKIPYSGSKTNTEHLDLDISLFKFIIHYSSSQKKIQ